MKNVIYGCHIIARPDDGPIFIFPNGLDKAGYINLRAMAIAPLERAILLPEKMTFLQRTAVRAIGFVFRSRR